MTIPLRVRLAAALLAGFCGIGHAACDTGLAERMHGKLHPQRTLDHERAVCEPWRGMLGRFIVLLPLARPSTDPDVTEYDLDVLVVQQADNGNTDRARIVGRLFEPRALVVEDDRTVAALKVDTARYTLAPDARAFGVRTVVRGTSRADPYESERLALYVPQPQGMQLDKVLDGLEIALERGVWDSNCSGDFQALRGSVSVVRGTGSGYADLLLYQTASRSRSSLQGEECVTREQPATFRATTLRFDGKRYPVPRRALP
jgi:hypothetical protein